MQYLPCDHDLLSPCRLAPLLCSILLCCFCLCTLLLFAPAFASFLRRLQRCGLLHFPDELALFCSFLCSAWTETNKEREKPSSAILHARPDQKKKTTGSHQGLSWSKDAVGQGEDALTALRFPPPFLPRLQSSRSPASTKAHTCAHSPLSPLSPPLLPPTRIVPSLPLKAPLLSPSRPPPLTLFPSLPFTPIFLLFFPSPPRFQSRSLCSRRFNQPPEQCRRRDRR